MFLLFWKQKTKQKNKSKQQSPSPPCNSSVHSLSRFFSFSLFSFLNKSFVFTVSPSKASILSETTFKKVTNEILVDQHNGFYLVLFPLMIFHPELNSLWATLLDPSPAPSESSISSLAPPLSVCGKHSSQAGLGPSFSSLCFPKSYLYMRCFSSRSGLSTAHSFIFMDFQTFLPHALLRCLTSKVCKTSKYQCHFWLLSDCHHVYQCNICYAPCLFPVSLLQIGVSSQ